MNIMKRDRGDNPIHKAIIKGVVKIIQRKARDGDKTFLMIDERIITDNPEFFPAYVNSAHEHHAIVRDEDGNLWAVFY